MLLTNKLSVVIIAFNEEDNIQSCIASVRGLADEIVVVDSFSTDRTAEIAKNLGAMVLHHEFEGHIQQKNWAKSQASYPFVLSLDADECLSEALRSAIEEQKKLGFPFNGYTMNRLNHLKNKPIKGCGWYPDTKLRLWNRDKGQWTGTNPHDRFELKNAEPTMHLPGDILHFTYATNLAVFKQAIKFGKVGAASIADMSNFNIVFKFLTSPYLKFIKNYVIKGGIVYGWRGFYICFCQWLESFIKYGTVTGVIILSIAIAELLFSAVTRLF